MYQLKHCIQTLGTEMFLYDIASAKKNLVTHSKTIIPFTAFITIFELSQITTQFTDSVRRPKTNFPLNILSVTPG